MYELLEFLFTPLVWIMEIVLLVYISTLTSVGLSILLLGLTFSASMLPVRRFFETKEQKLRASLEAVNDDIQKIHKSIRGEQRFQKIEKIYKAHNYHPIHNIGLIGSLLSMVPALISAIFLFSGESVLIGTAFGKIDDLSLPDNLFNGMNVLPAILLCINAIDSHISFGADKSMKIKFFFVSVFICVLIYPLAAGLLLYWIAGNVFSLFLSFLSKRKK